VTGCLNTTQLDNRGFAPLRRACQTERSDRQGFELLFSVE
jgi:hypothetical protein